MLLLLHIVAISISTTVYSFSTIPVIVQSRAARIHHINASIASRSSDERKRNGKRSNLRHEHDFANENIVIDPNLNQERLQSSIDCDHFHECAGCVANESIDEVEAVKSAKLFFATEDKSGSVEHSDFYEVVVPSPLTGWRTQAKLAVAAKSGSGKWKADGCVFGLYERASHQVMPIPNCKVHHPSINYAVELLSKATETVGTVPFNEQSGEGGLRYVQLQVERSTGKVCLTLIWNAADLKRCQPGLSRLIKELRRLDPKLFHSIWCHTNDSLGNSIIARGERRWHPMEGPEFVREQIPGTDLERREGLLYFNPMAFRQGNMNGFDAIAQHVARAVPPGSKVCELYAGVGLLGITALMHHGRQSNDGDWVGSQEPLKWLHCSDENPANPRCFGRAINSMPTEITGKVQNQKRNADSNKASRGKWARRRDRRQSKRELTISDMMNEVLDEGFSTESRSDGPKVTYKVASAAKALRSGECLGANVLIVDPPRKGLEDEVILELCKAQNYNQIQTEDPMLLQGPRHAINWANDVTLLIYVSCGFDALARDTDRLLRSNSGWTLKSTTGYILFPGSNHVETVAIFER